MINAERYIQDLTRLLQLNFGSRLVYVGLQGSYLRGEASDSSDIDIMVVVDNLDVNDLLHYRNIIQSLEDFDKSCGFICSKADMENWNPLEICHLLHTTKDYYGLLKELVPNYNCQDVRNFIKISLNNLYHEICHRYIHSQDFTDIAKLTGSYKSVFFILQNLYYLTHGMYISTKSELLLLLDGINHEVLTRAIELNSGCENNFDESFALLFKWCQDTLQTL